MNYNNLQLNNKGQYAKEVYWIANYDDKTQLKQFEGTKENKYADIDRERLVRFDLIDYDTNKAVLSVYINEGKQLIFRRRTLKRFDGSPDVVIFLVGYKQTIMTSSGVRAFISINYLHPDGSISLDGARDNLELLPIEG